MTVPISLSSCLASSLALSMLSTTSPPTEAYRLLSSAIELQLQLLDLHVRTLLTFLAIIIPSYLLLVPIPKCSAAPARYPPSTSVLALAAP
ncbi:hypothetical protein CPB84DRAFT_1787398 [Gymnopilus junonius]|uniref:Uncharacterized protein n=1 Tax=Gymnopilus junonius TaxID=109634 RepID=A0A9P5NGM3_GYMJU|nr:hypothetical protein CPB84DRAFT_1787398 [Gymnopilus junonius]